MIRSAVLSSVALLALAACNAPESANTPDAKASETVAPAVVADAASATVLTPLGYGPLKIGMTQAEVDAAVGLPPANAAEAAGFHTAAVPADATAIHTQSSRIGRIDPGVDVA